MELALKLVRTFNEDIRMEFELFRRGKLTKRNNITIGNNIEIRKPAGGRGVLEFESTHETAMIRVNEYLKTEGDNYKNHKKQVGVKKVFNIKGRRKDENQICGRKKKNRYEKKLRIK